MYIGTKNYLKSANILSMNGISPVAPEVDICFHFCNNEKYQFLLSVLMGLKVVHNPFEYKFAMKIIFRAS